MTVTRQRKEIAPYARFDDQDTRTIINEVRRGKTNNGGEVTLDDNADTTTLSDPLITSNSVILFVGATANAKAEGMPYYDDSDLSPGQVVLHHANNAQTDRRYKYTVNC